MISLKWYDRILHLALVLALVLGLGTGILISKEVMAQSWPTSWTLVDTDPPNDGAGDDYKDVVAASYNFTAGYLYLRLCMAGAGIPDPSGGEYKWFFDLDGGMGLVGPSVRGSEFILFVESNNIYLLDAGGDDTYSAYAGFAYRTSPGPVTNSTIAGYRVQGQCFDMYVKLSALGISDVSEIVSVFWATDGPPNQNLIQAPQSDHGDVIIMLGMLLPQLSYKLTDTDGNPLQPNDNIPNIAQPYNVVITLQNPDTISHTYTIQLVESLSQSAILQGGLKNLPSGVLQTIISILGGPAKWDANPSCILDSTELTAIASPGDTTIAVASTSGFPTSGTLCIGATDTAVTYTQVTPTSFTGIPPSGPGAIKAVHNVGVEVTLSQLTTPPKSATVAPGASATLTFTFTNTWHWIPEWSWKYLASTLLWADVTQALPPDPKLVVMLVRDLARLITFSDELAGSGFIIPSEQFDFRVLLEQADVLDFPVTVGVPVTLNPTIGKKFLEYCGAMVASAPAGKMTFFGLAACLTGAGCAGGAGLLLGQAGLIALQNGIYASADDPNPDYTQVVQPTPLTLSDGTLFMNLPVVQSLTDSQRQILQALANAVSYQDALTSSIARYVAAVAAGSQNYADLQLQAVVNYASVRDLFLTMLENQISLITPQPELDQASFQYAYDLLQTNGLPDAEKQVLTGLGLSSSISDITAGLQVLNATMLNGFNLTSEVEMLGEMLSAETGAWYGQALQTKSPTTLTMSSSANPSVYGQPVSISANVTAIVPAYGTPTGNVTFCDGATVLGTGALNSSGQVIHSISTLAPGSHAIIAMYSGDDYYISNSGNLTQMVWYNFSGFLPPLGKSTYGLGSTIPIKWQLKEYNGNFIGDLKTVTSLLVGPVGGTLVSPTPSSGTTALRYDTTANQYIFNWQTKDLQKGNYTISLSLNDGTVHATMVTLQ
jgi:hypothetical protein